FYQSDWSRDKNSNKITMDRLKLYIKESYNELVNKVTWPSLASLQQTTVVVIVGSIILTGIVAIMDGVWKNLLTTIYDLG
ncbi:MAG: preprotein translocase subunit SecE, partial [Saprospiraceae bacterium]